MRRLIFVIMLKSIIPIFTLFLRAQKISAVVYKFLLKLLTFSFNLTFIQAHWNILSFVILISPPKWTTGQTFTLLQLFQHFPVTFERLWRVSIHFYEVSRHMTSLEVIGAWDPTYTLCMWWAPWTTSSRPKTEKVTATCKVKINMKMNNTIKRSLSRAWKWAIVHNFWTTGNIKKIRKTNFVIFGQNCQNCQNCLFQNCQNCQNWPQKFFSSKSPENRSAVVFY